MTPKEKAAYIYDIYSCVLPDAVENNKRVIKDAATTAVDEIIKASPTNTGWKKYHEYLPDLISDSIDYWQDVKVEIEKL